MSTTIAKMSPAVAGGSPYQLDYATLIAAGYVIPETEVGAAEQYIFDAAVMDVLRDRLSSYVAVQGDLAVTAPSVLTDRVVLDGDYGGLLLNTADQTEITVAVIYQRPTATVTNVMPIIGTDTGISGNTGFGIFTADTGGLNLSIRPGTGDPAIVSAVSGALVPKGSWVFVAASLSATDTAIHLGHGGTLTTATASGVSRGLASNVYLGKIADMGASYGSDDLSVRMATVWRSALTADDVLAAYRRAKVLCERRGWDLV